MGNSGLDLTVDFVALAVTPDCSQAPDLDLDIDFRPIPTDWPVGIFKNITVDIAIEVCQAQINAAGAASGCLGLVGFEFQAELDGCVEDIKVS